MKKIISKEFVHIINNVYSDIDAQLPQEANVEAKLTHKWRPKWDETTLHFLFFFE